MAANVTWPISTFTLQSSNIWNPCTTDREGKKISFTVTKLDQISILASGSIPLFVIFLLKIYTITPELSNIFYICPTDGEGNKFSILLTLLDQISILAFGSLLLFLFFNKNIALKDQISILAKTIAYNKNQCCKHLCD